MTEQEQYDVVIMGGGLAGLTLSLQLVQRRPQTSILVVERTEHPVPEAAHKVGEATVENSAHYYADVLGLRDYLESRHYRKMGLRFFPTAEVPTPLTERVEAGPRDFLTRRTFQIDRGRFENDVTGYARQAGVEVIDGARIAGVTLDADGGHRVTVSRGDDEEAEVRARWLVDATGRRSLLKRELGLEEDNAHDINAVWLRLADFVTLDELPAEHGDEDDDAIAGWRERVPNGQRWRSTSHLMGRGYWLWLIPLASGSISIGLVCDPEHVPFEEINRPEKLQAWLDAYEPEVGAAVRRREGSRQDFRMMKGISYHCQRVFSADRWCLTGEAGCFLDPLYSPGGDFIGLSNTYVTDLVTRELDGEDVTERAERANAAYLEAVEHALQVFEGQYGLMGHPEVWSLKCAWDTLAYFGVLNVLWVNDRLGDLDWMPSVEEHMRRYHALNERIQAAFREWDAGTTPTDPGGGPLVDLSAPAFAQLNAELDDRLDDDDALRARVARNVAFLEGVARAVGDRGLAAVGPDADAPALRALTEIEAAPAPADLPDPRAVVDQLWAEVDVAVGGAS